MSTSLPTNRQYLYDLLYDLVWSKPLAHLARDLGLSDVGLAKLCRRAAIPTPPRGHWVKVRAGKKPKRPPSGPAPKGVSEQIPLPSPSRESTPKQQPRVDVPEVPVHDRLTSPHPLVAASRKHLSDRWVDPYGRGEARRGPCLDLRVTPDSIPRFLRIMDALIKALEERGCEVHALERDTSGYRRRAEIIVIANGEKVRIILREAGRERKLEPTAQEKREAARYGREPCIRRAYDPTGRLTLEVDGWAPGVDKRVGDTSKRPLEDRLGLFVVAVDSALEAHRERTLEREREQRARAEAARVEAERKRREEAEAARVHELRDAAARWKEAQVIRESSLMPWRGRPSRAGS